MGSINHHTFTVHSLSSVLPINLYLIKFCSAENQTQGGWVRSENAPLSYASPSVVCLPCYFFVLVLVLFCRWWQWRLWGLKINDGLTTKTKRTLFQRERDKDGRLVSGLLEVAANLPLAAAAAADVSAAAAPVRSSWKTKEVTSPFSFFLSLSHSVRSGETNLLLLAPSILEMVCLKMGSTLALIFKIVESARRRSKRYLTGGQ